MRDRTAACPVRLRDARSGRADEAITRSLLSEALADEARWTARADTPDAARCDGRIWLLERVADRQVVGLLRIAAGRLSYCVSAPYRRHGYGSELLRHVHQLTGHDNVPAELTASVVRENVVSARLLERHGFTFLGLAHAASGFGVVTLLDYRLFANRPSPARCVSR